jgi:hypothetical protein
MAQQHTNARTSLRPLTLAEGTVAQVLPCYTTLRVLLA